MPVSPSPGVREWMAALETHTMMIMITMMIVIVVI